MCTVLLPPGVNPIAVNKYVNKLRKIGLISTQRQVRKPVSNLSPTIGARLLAFNRTRSRVVTGLIIRLTT